MDLSEFHQQAMELVGAVLERAPHERATFLDRHCGGNQRLRDEVESLLEFEKETADFSEPIILIRPDDSESPRRVGPYEILRSLGTGGMGDVYLARQEKPVRRQVALKLIHSDLFSHEIARRFEIERDILARLQHPNIAQLLDAGADADGRPYFAMEYVDGRPIGEHCNRAKLSIRQRLELFRKVCSAVELAHRNLVVHRDLKPGNILVDRSGEPKLLDFGVAKLLQSSSPSPQGALQGDSSGVTALTAALGRPPMTLAYASPEMLAGEMINTVSDIYSLGVILYRLLCGRHPYPVCGHSSAEIDRTIRTQEPKRPSTAVARTKELRSSGETVDQRTPEMVSELRGTDPKGLRRELAGDLDCIVLKTLRKEPEERYGSVVELSEDILRYLRGLPVAARADTFRYRAEKFVRRHRLALATAAAFLVVVAGLVVALLLQMEQVRKERDRANRSHDLFVEIIEKTDPEEEEEILTPEGVVKRGIDFFGKSFAQEHDLQATVFDSLGRVYAHRGFYDSARRLLEKALEMRRETLGDDHSMVAESRLNLAYLLEKMGEFEKAEELSRSGLETQRRYYRGPHIELARAISNHATQLGRLGELERAEELYLESHEMRIALYGDVHLSVAISFDALGTVYHRLRDLDKALESYLRSRKIREQLLPPEHPKMAMSFNQIGTILYEQRAYVEAETAHRRALEIRREKYDEEHPLVATSRHNLALTLLKLGRYGEAETFFRQALDTRCGVLGDEHPSCANTQTGLAKLLVARGNPESAEVLASQASENYERMGLFVRAAFVKVVLGACFAARQRYEEAEETMLENYSIIREALGDNAPATDDARRALFELYEAWGKPERAEKYRD